MATSNTVYVLDKHDRIISVSGPWDTFADENDGVHVFSEDVRGRPIWDFVAGDTTKMWLDAVFQFARLSGTSVERPYRCDSPRLKRFMRMRVDVEEGGILRIEHETVATEQRVAPVHIQYGGHTRKKTRQRCSICGRVNDGGWQEPRPEHADESDGITVIYTVCEDCKRLMPGA